jgi:hypothetical protein
MPISSGVSGTITKIIPAKKGFWALRASAKAAHLPRPAPGFPLYLLPATPQKDAASIPNADVPISSFNFFRGKKDDTYSQHARVLPVRDHIGAHHRQVRKLPARRADIVVAVLLTFSFVPR